jgi:anthranilate synthase/aminodeoxychorismate synthase-like glutamine amidotransferase
MLLVIDNYDSFTYNLVDQLRRLSSNSAIELAVYRNDQISVPEALKLAQHGLVISPGPGGPLDTGICLQLLSELPAELPVLGICLGHQALAHFYQAKVVRAERPVHGETALLYHNSRDLFSRLKRPIKVARYHSLVVDSQLSSELILTGWSQSGEVMAIKHTSLPRWGLQFHPESFLTEQGDSVVAEFLERLGGI